jgi:hypothetical protein
MAMSISPAQMMLQDASAKSAALAGRSTPASAPAAAPAVESPGESSTPAPDVSSAPQFSTDTQIDSQHQIYYKVVDDSTGDVMFEIPSAALRAIGENLNVPLVGDANVPDVDVKS